MRSSAVRRRGRIGGLVRRAAAGCCALVLGAAGCAQGGAEADARGADGPFAENQPLGPNGLINMAKGLSDAQVGGFEWASPDREKIRRQRRGEPQPDADAAP